MRNISDEVNRRPLGHGCTPNGSYEKPVCEYRGWTIDKWTGWKGNTVVFEKTDSLGIIKCPECGNGFKPGDILVRHEFGEMFEHINCSKHEIKGQIIGQWLARKGRYEDADVRFAYSSVPGSQGEYHRGDSFIVTVQCGQQALTPETAQEVLDAAREEGLRRLKAAIDAIEGSAS